MKRVQCPRSVEGARQQGKIRLGEFLSPPEQAHDDKEISIGKKRTPEFGHHDRIRHGGDDSYGKDADRKIGPSPCLLESYGRQAEGYGPRGGGPRYLLFSLLSSGFSQIEFALAGGESCVDAAFEV